MNSQDFLLSIFFFIFFLSTSFVSAVNFPVNSFAQLKSALQNANNGDNIVIQKDIPISSALSQIKKSVTIRSSDAKCLTSSSQRRRCRLVAQSSFRHFSIGKGGKLTVRRIEFRSGIGSSGGGSLLVTGGGTLDVRDCAFRFNKASALLLGGGAISVQSKSSLKVERSLFVRNSGSFGGAIDVSDSSKANISTCNFNRNWGRLVGGALSVSLDSSVTVYKNTFSRNYAYFGGVTYVKGSKVSFCRNTYGYKNAAGLKGNRNYIESSQINTCADSKSSFFLTKASSIKSNCAACSA